MVNLNNFESLTLLHSFFLKSANLYPDNYALSIGDRKWTFSEIKHEASRWANILIKNSNKQPKRIGVFGNKSYPSYVGVLASLFSGATYVPLNQKFPKERTLSMIVQSDLDAIIVDSQSFPILEELLPSIEKKLLILCPENIINKSPTSKMTFFDKNYINDAVNLLDILPEVNEDSFAYLLFTSGSTGIPKGVPISHKNVASFLKYNLKKYKFTPEDKFTQTFDLTFDLSVFDLFMSWGSGACLCVMQPIELLSPFNFIKKHEITVWFSVPSIISLYRKKQLLKPNCLPTLKWSLFCGEALQQSSVEAWQMAAPQSIIENLYGPTELTIACAAYRWDNNTSPQKCRNGIVPIGKVFDTLDSIVIDENNIPVNNGETGQLCVSGPQMFCGYLNNNEQTLKCFVNIGSKTYYKTGDLVRLENNDYIYLGRSDHQVKVQGYRIELGEIESILRLIEGVIEAVVIPWPIINGEVQGLVAFVSGNDINIEKAKDVCKEHLPYYMQPKKIHHRKNIPYNSNGKIDYNALKNSLNEDVI